MRLLTWQYKLTFGLSQVGSLSFQQTPPRNSPADIVLLLGPCYSSNNSIEVNISAFDVDLSTTSEWWNQTYDEYQTRFLEDYPGREPLTPEQLAERQRRKAIKDLPHPSRPSYYNMELTPKLAMRPDEFSSRKDWSMIALVRNISNISTQFRKEFAHVFWGRTRILLQDSELYHNLPLLPKFIRERPAICSGIRELRVFLSSIAVSTFYNDEEEKRFLELCKAISALPSLEFLNIAIMMFDDQVNSLKPGSRMHRCFKTIRSLPVKKKFALTLDFDDLWVDLDEDRRYLAELQEKWTRKIKKIMLPNTLRVSRDTSAKGQYLRSRPKVDITRVNDVADCHGVDKGAESSSAETDYESTDEGSEE